MRSSGVLMHITSLPSPYGIGTLGKEAKDFVDFLKCSGQSYWQILPLGPTSYGNSPYQSFSSFAGNPYLIDLDEVCKIGYLTTEECSSFSWNLDETHVDYGLLYDNRYALFQIAYKKFKEHKPKDFKKFCKENESWLLDYALFMSLKIKNHGKSWFEWTDQEIRFREKATMKKLAIALKDEIESFQMLQYFFFQQWNELKKYANKNGIKIIGDVPIYVAGDSSDVWANPKLFYLDKNKMMTEVAGCPPDDFSEDGQLWGNPLFRWDVMKKDGYAWWEKRLKAMTRMYDVVRIDHFRGFDSYYSISTGEDTAKNGVWKKGPGIKLFQTMEKKLGKLNIIAEDLGFLTPSVKKMLEKSGYPGMKVLQFAFGAMEDNLYQPHNYPVHSVAYVGTHDNDTILGWVSSIDKKTLSFAENYLRLTKEEGYNWGMMKSIWSSASELSIVTMQDLLGLSSEARMNKPSTLSDNWNWRMKSGALTKELEEKIKQNMMIYARLPKKKEKQRKAKDKEKDKEKEIKGKSKVQK